MRSAMPGPVQDRAGAGELPSGLRPVDPVREASTRDPLGQLRQRLVVGDAVVAVVGLGYVGPDERIADQTGSAPVAFAYPFGAYGADRANDPRIRAVWPRRSASAHEIAFHQDDQDEMTLVGCGDRALELRRLDVEGWTVVELVERIADAAARTEPGLLCS